MKSYNVCHTGWEIFPLLADSLRQSGIFMAGVHILCCWFSCKGCHKLPSHGSLIALCLCQTPRLVHATESNDLGTGNVTVLGASVGNAILNLGRRHPGHDGPLIDWDLILIMVRSAAVTDMHR